ncbi:hypothetical protein CsSME_00043810 [Camellia sinensis var. sinensis]
MVQMCLIPAQTLGALSHPPTSPPPFHLYLLSVARLSPSLSPDLCLSPPPSHSLPLPLSPLSQRRYLSPSLSPDLCLSPSPPTLPLAASPPPPDLCLFPSPPTLPLAF